MDENLDIVTLIDEEGKKFEFEVVDYFLVDKLEYAVLLPVRSKLSDLDESLGISFDDRKESITYDDELDDEDGKNEDEAVILRVTKGNNGEESLHIIDDEDEWQKVAEIAIERLYEQEEE